MREEIDLELKRATLGQDRRRTNILRLIVTTMRDRDRAKRAAGSDGLSDHDVLEILMTMVKQRVESARSYDEEGRADLATQERDEIAVIKSLMPRELDETEMRDACSEAIRQTNAHGLRDMGRCMAELKARYGGQVDLTKAIEFVRSKLQ